MKRKLTKIISIILVLCMILSFVACNNRNEQDLKSGNLEKDNVLATVSDELQKNFMDEENDIEGSENISSTVNADNVFSSESNITDNTMNNNIQNLSESDKDSLEVSPKGEYKEGVVLVKVKTSYDKTSFGKLQYCSTEALFNGSKWYSVQLEDNADTVEAVNYLTELGTFDKVDFDYIMGVGAETESVDVSCNPDYDKHKHHHTHKVPDGWKYATDNGKRSGGSSDVVIAVIDTGVDYTHLDLRNNIWVNTAEIAGNGKDDDDNGYVDDVYGWDCVGDDNNPMDDNGHGTHVAGIIASENNEIGGVGIAYNCKVMVVKAGNSSGYFNNSDIAEAIQYAYMNGASVINMSFGGSNISIAVEEALENAYNSCVLVAAAGNDGLCNNLSCKTCDAVGVSYPAALPYVIGVMSTNAEGSKVSSFSNYDHTPYNSVEYEVYAVGESIPSTWPGNKYASLNGTSMAAPTVSGIAALLRSYYSDREVYSTKFIQSQIVNTGTLNPYNYINEETDDAHSVTNIYEALTQIPKPEVNLYDYFIDDSTSISAANNGNGVIDAGETVRLYISLHNRGGVAGDVNVSIDTNRGEGLTDPYFIFVNSTMQLSDIGTYSIRESGDKYFEIVVSGDCPNDYLVDFNIRYTYTNGMDETDTVVYEDDGKQKAQFNVSSGYHLPATITEDTIYKADKLYIVGQDVVIPEGVTVTFEEGCEIQFYDDREYYNSPVVTVYGTLNILGKAESKISLEPSERYAIYAYCIDVFGTLVIDYVDSVNLKIKTHDDTVEATIKNSYMNENGSSYNNSCSVYCIKNGSPNSSSSFDIFEYSCILHNVTYSNNYISLSSYAAGIGAKYVYNNIFLVSATGSADLYAYNFINNQVITHNQAPMSWASNFRVTNEAVNNQFSSLDSNVKNLISLKFDKKILVQNNMFDQNYQTHAFQVIDGYYDTSGNPTIDIYGSCSDISVLWPYVVSVDMFNADGELITTVGREEVKVRVTFNRPMDTSKNTYLTFGTIEPYADYRIDGEWISDTVWEGSYTLKAQIENGQNFLMVNNACAAEDSTKVVFGEYQLHEFTIDTTVAMSMNLQATETDEGIELTWAQDDYDTLMGYNIYRSDSKDGNYVKLNPAILLSTEESFLDENAEPGKTYWYTFTVVLSDFSESAPAGKVIATAKDTQSPSLYHTPVNQGYENNNLVISCTASDNAAITNVTLHYRTVGATEWKTLSMVKQNDKYSATIYGSDVTMEGIEYYIIATDGLNTVAKGSEETPYTIVVKSADTLTQMGDVDGNGVVSTKDALMLMQCINGDLLLSDDQFIRADLNEDGVLSSVEALRILQYINGKVTTLEM